MGKTDLKRAANAEVRAGIPWSKLEAASRALEQPVMAGYWYRTVEFVVCGCALIEHVELEWSIERLLYGVEVTPRLNAVRDLQAESRGGNVAPVFLGTERFQDLARSSGYVIHDVFCGSESASCAPTSRSQVTFRLPDVSSVHAVSCEACPSDSVTNTRRSININVFGIVLYANRKVVQVWSGTGKGDWTINALVIGSISVCFSLASQGGQTIPWSPVRFAFQGHRGPRGRSRTLWKYASVPLWGIRPRVSHRHRNGVH